MNAFDEAKTVEARGMAILLPYIAGRSKSGYVLIEKGPLARHLQLIAGDVMYNAANSGGLVAAEVKIEQRHTGNLFLEVWSNRNLEHRESHSERGSAQGWLYHSRADWLLYYFLDTDDLYAVDLFKLKRWAFCEGRRCGRIWDFPERQQGAREQLNDTRGRLVSVDVLAKEIGLRHVKVQQLALWADEDAA